MPQHLDTGNTGEDLAAAYLEEKNYRILCRNYRYRRAEVDLIAEKDNLLVFVEVKTRTNVGFGEPENFVNAAQKNRIRQAAENYIFETDWQHDIRFDIIAITGLTPPQIEHFEDI
jgi:putative endonuclease